MSRKSEEFTQLAGENNGRELDLEAFEEQVEREKRALGAQRVDAFFAKLKPETPHPKRCPRCGKFAKLRAKAVERTLKSRSGEHTFKRNYHYCETCSHGFYPVDERLGLSKEGDLSPAMEKLVLDFAVNETYENASERFEVHHSQKLSANQFRQVAKRVGKELEDSHPIFLGAELRPPTLEKTQTLYVMNDGGMLPMQHGEWKEAKMAVLFRDENHTPHRENSRGSISAARYTAVLGDQEEFREELKVALLVENAQIARRVVWIADGALGNWLTADLLFPNAIQILDWSHALEHAMDLGKVLLGETSPLLPLWQQRMSTLLYAGNVGSLIEELMSIEPAELTDEQLTGLNDFIRYLRNNEEKMRYAEFVEKGLLIGSGAVESAHRHVLQVRMKRAGQHWSEEHGRRMVRLRAAYRTAGPKRFRPAIRWAYRKTTDHRRRTAASS